MDQSLRTTALTVEHERRGAKLGAFAGWRMPIRFAGTITEHTAVRESVGVFDVSHLGTVFIDGPDATAVIAASFTNDPGRITDGAAQYTLCCADDGGVLDDLIVYRLHEQRWLAVPNAANNAAVVDTLERAAAERDATVVDEGPAWAVLAVQGPSSLERIDAVLADLGERSAPAMATPSFGVAHIEVEGRAGFLARTGYTGERGVELVIPNDVAPALWRALLEVEVEPCGLGARDTLRLEAGLPLHGNELSPATTPFEARLGWAVVLDRAAFQGQRALIEAKQEGPRRRLWGLLVEGRRPAREGMEVQHDGRSVGEVTSGTFSPTLERPIALAYLATGLEPEETVSVDVRGRQTTATVVRPPFVRR
ncbi:MAG: glycine cleavage system aminomethyltransferase GcvT [Nitriliruptoraceae bacterium]